MDHKQNSEIMVIEEMKMSNSFNKLIFFQKRLRDPKTIQSNQKEISEFSQRKLVYKADEKRKCKLCLIYKYNHLFSIYMSCQHNLFCNDCLLEIVKMKILDYHQMQCQITNCPGKLKYDSDFFRKNLDKKIEAYYYSKNSIKINHCRIFNCGGLIQTKFFKCRICSQSYCRKCLNFNHEEICHPQNIYTNSKLKQQSIIFVLKCPKCKQLILQNCPDNYMKCICKYEFCTICNEQWKRYHYYCGKSSLKGWLKKILRKIANHLR